MNDRESEARSTVSRLIGELKAGRRDARRQLFERVYEELRRIARRHMERESPGHTLAATDLVNNAYLRLCDQEWENRKHFYFTATRAMRQLLVEHARRKHARKRGGGLAPQELDYEVAAEVRDIPLLELDEALDDLQAVRPRHAEIVHLRFFAGFSHAEIADCLGVSESTVEKNWRFAKAWLRERLSSDSVS